MEQRIRQLLGFPPEDPFCTDIQPQYTDLLRHEEFNRLEREILANDFIAAQQIFVAEMRALVIELGAKAEAAAPERQWKSEDVVGIDQIVRRRTHVELGEDAAHHIQLKAFAGVRATDAKQAERIADAHRGDRRVLAARIVQGAEGAVQITDKRSRFFWIRDQRAEYLVFGKAHRAGGFRLVNAGATPRRIDRLRTGWNRDGRKHDQERQHEGTTRPIHHGARPSGKSVRIVVRLKPDTTADL